MNSLFEQMQKQYEKEIKEFQKDLSNILNNKEILDLLVEYNFDNIFLKDLLERLSRLGSKKAIKSLLKNPSKLKKVLYIYSNNPDWSEEDKFISVSNYLEYNT